MAWERVGLVSTGGGVHIWPKREHSFSPEKGIHICQGGEGFRLAFNRMGLVSTGRGPRFGKREGGSHWPKNEASDELEGSGGGEYLDHSLQICHLTHIN